MLFQQYLQWIAAEQWRRARAQAQGVALIGDLPFMVDGDSADVWVRPDEFRLDVSVGAPPDAFSATGQDWGMPLYRWDVMSRNGFAWLRDRARRGADLFDGFRVDHLVGFYRTFGWPRDGSPPFFSPPDEPSQLNLGERLLEVFRGAGADIIAEDLGTIPDFVRASLVRLGVPGFRVFRWERHWHTDGQPFRDPAEYPRVSVASSGTHDTEPLATWWDAAPAAERRAVGQVPAIARRSRGADFASADFDAGVRDALLEALFASGSDLLLLPVQDVFGWRDRINVPATTTDDNWTFRLPWLSDMLDEVPEARERKDRLRAWAERYERT